MQERGKYNIFNILSLVVLNILTHFFPFCFPTFWGCLNCCAGPRKAYPVHESGKCIWFNSPLWCTKHFNILCFQLSSSCMVLWSCQFSCSSLQAFSVHEEGQVLHCSTFLVLNFQHTFFPSFMVSNSTRFNQNYGRVVQDTKQKDLQRWTFAVLHKVMGKYPFSCQIIIFPAKTSGFEYLSLEGNSVKSCRKWCFRPSRFQNFPGEHAPGPP